ncbi:polymeric immunoglobulin receptor-like [Pygocentrus nattereri]|nr:polymeric immunoglobulin receptor-like [Pygocentrus nattereri]
MWLCVFLLYSVLQESSGCTVERGVGATITKSVGDSVVLPCSCTNLQDNPQTVQWGFTNFKQFKFVVGDYTADESVFSEDGSQKHRYRNRVQRLNQNKPGDLSLIISHLMEQDEGAYLCGINGKYFSIIFVYVRGCAVLGFSERSFSRSKGESVLLPCPCPKEQTNINPGGVTWSFSKTGTGDQTAVSNDTESYTGRVWMFDQKHSRNFSLLISDLTEEDSGEYNCIADDHTPYVMLHVKGCTLSETQEKLIIRSLGESVLLPCSCTDQQTKPVSVKWEHVDSGGTEVSNETPRYSGRVQMFNKNLPANLSLLISNLTEQDQGTYRCSINNKQSINIRLSIVTQHENSTDFFSVIVNTLSICVALLLIVVIGESALIYKLIHNRSRGSASTNPERRTQSTADNDYKDDPPENRYNITMEQIYQSLDPKTNQSDSVYQSLSHEIN